VLSCDEVTNRTIIALSTDSKIYKIKNTTINIITSPYPNLPNIKNIYSSATSNFIIKTHYSTYYNYSNYLGEFDSVHIVADKLLIIKNDEVFGSASASLDKNIDMLKRIPEGSFLRFYNKGNHTISITPLSDFDSILYSMPILDYVISICCVTGEVYDTLNGVVIPKLRNCLFSKADNNYSRIKRAIN
jgi:hypothetical protein